MSGDQHTAQEVAWALSGRRAQRLSDGGWLASCPVRSHGRGRGDRTPSLRIIDGETQLLVHCHAGCDRRDVLDALRSRGLMARKEGVATANPTPPRPKIDGRDGADDNIRRIRYAREIWETAGDPRGTLAELYLNFYRHLALDAPLAGRVLRFHPHTPWRDENTGKTERVPALIAAFRSIDDDEITAIHRIALNPDGSKIGKRMLGIVQRAAIKIDADVSDELAVSEGIENAMTARVLRIRPVWALGSAGGITKFPVLPGISSLRLIGERCRVNADAVEMCGKRWRVAGRRVCVIVPPTGCKDLNDAL